MILKPNSVHVAMINEFKRENKMKSQDSFNAFHVKQEQNMITR